VSAPPIDPAAARYGDEHAATYTAAFDATFTSFLKYQLVARIAKATDVCLDVGVANGLFAIPVAAHVREVHGVDASAAMLDECRRNLARAGVSNVVLHQQDARALQFPDASFDLVYSFSTLVIVPEPERAYAEIARVLRPGRPAVLDITGRFNLSQRHWGRYYRARGHFGVNAYSLAGMRQCLADVGLRVHEVHATGLCDQWKYVPGLRRARFLDGLLHGTRRTPDLDYRVSQWLPRLANRWYVVATKGEWPQ
jgi:SAM-dependent methyltransferase